MTEAEVMDAATEFYKKTLEDCGFLRAEDEKRAESMIFTLHFAHDTDWKSTVIMKDYPSQTMFTAVYSPDKGTMTATLYEAVSIRRWKKDEV